VVEVLPVFEVICNSVFVPKLANPGFANTIEPGLVPTLTLAIPDGGAGRNDVDAVEEVKEPVPLPKS
jgi:hypothetical protein